MSSYDWLVDLLSNLAGKAELRLTARYREEPLLKSVIEAEPWLARDKYRTHGDKIQHGKEILEAIERKRDLGKRNLFGRLGPLLHDYVVDEHGSATSFGASLLINRKDLAQLDSMLDEFARASDELDFKCVGPLAPYSFVRDVLHVPQEEAWA
jgi:hypothetical protein